jgi:hypothetical protein
VGRVMTLEALAWACIAIGWLALFSLALELKK